MTGEYLCHGEFMAMACTTLIVADRVMAMANKRATVRVNMSDISTRATSKIRRKCPDGAPFTIPVMP